MLLPKLVELSGCGIIEMKMDAKNAFNWADSRGGTETISLWECLHDGELSAIHDDRLDCSMCFEFHVPYLCSFHGLPDDVTFRLRLEGLHSVQVGTWQPWPGGWVEPEPANRSDRDRLWAEYVAKGRRESESWNALASLVSNRDGRTFDVSDATLLPAVGSVVLKLSVSMESDHYYEVVVGAERLVLSRSDGVPMDLLGFLALGNGYWEAFASRAQSS